MSLDYTFYCNICDKYYKSIQSLSNHKSRFHKSGKPKVNIKTPLGKPKVNINDASGKPKVNIPNIDDIEDDNIKYYYCDFCDKKYVYKQSKYRHQKKCKSNLKNENDFLKKEIENIKENLMEILKKNCKMHPKTLEKINKQLSQKQNNNNCGIVNNGNIINNYTIQFGNENLLDVLTKKEQIMILDKKHQSLNHLIEYVHFNDKFPQFQNIAITNMKDNIAYMFNEERNNFIAMNKNELLDTVIDMRMLDIEDFYENNIENINEATKKNISNFLNKMSNSDEYLEMKKTDIKLVLYNNTKTPSIKEIL
jgi:hypothetical protein